VNVSKIKHIHGKVDLTLTYPLSNTDAET